MNQPVFQTYYYVNNWYFIICITYNILYARIKEKLFILLRNNVSTSLISASHQTLKIIAYPRRFFRLFFYSIFSIISEVLINIASPRSEFGQKFTFSLCLRRRLRLLRNRDSITRIRQCEWVLRRRTIHFPSFFRLLMYLLGALYIFF